MRYNINNLWLQLPYEGLHIHDLTYSQELNEHSRITILAETGGRDAEGYLYQAIAKEVICIGEGTSELPFFQGCITGVQMTEVRGLPMLEISAASLTLKWDIKKKSRSFQNRDATYHSVINEVLGGYGNADWMDKIGCEVKVPGLLLQYEETDWEFLKRLASHFNTYLTADTQMAYGRAYIGIPHIDHGRELAEGEYTVSQDLEEYIHRLGSGKEYFPKEENLCFTIKSRARLQLGEQVTWKKLKCQAVSVTMELKQGELIWSYQLRRLEGMQAPLIRNHKIRGISLPAVIKARKGNCLRVRFDLDSTYRSGNNCYYTYAIETTSWYCLPDTGSHIHIYFPSEEEQSAIAVHAMHTGSGSRTSLPEIKSFSNSAGMLMELNKKEISFEAGNGWDTSMTIGGDGSISVMGEVIYLDASEKIRMQKETYVMGDSSMERVLRSLKIRATDSIAVSISDARDYKEDNALVITSLVSIRTPMVNYLGSLKLPPSILYSDAELKLLDAQERSAYNDNVMETKLQATTGKIGVGAICLAIGVVCVAAALTVISGGFAAPALITAIAYAGVVIGSTAAVYGASQVQEGIQDLNKIAYGDFSQSTNLIRDHLLGGNQELFDTILFQSTTIAFTLAVILMTFGTGTAAVEGLKATAKMALKQAVINATFTTGMYNLRDLNDGFIDVSLQEYAAMFGTEFAITFVSALGSKPIMELLKRFPAIKELFTNHRLAMVMTETILDTAIEVGINELFDRDYNVWLMFLGNFVSNIMCSMDPVNSATGAFTLAAGDLSFAAIGEEPFAIRRYYNSMVPFEGMLGRKWIFSYESGLWSVESGRKMLVLCTDGHMEGFVRSMTGEYVSEKGGSGRYTLEQGEGGYVFTDRPGRIRYHYNENGLLVLIEERNGIRTDIIYHTAANHGRQIRDIVHTSGYRYTFSYEEGKISRITDHMGREIRYRYEDDLLSAVIHVDEGLTTYHYDDRGNITVIVDQNGHAYVKNQYDEKSRVCTQYFLDGSKGIMEYDEAGRRNLCSLEYNNSREVYEYDEHSRITRVTYGDGTYSEYAYDAGYNKIYERDRGGYESHWEYGQEGYLLKESVSGGMQWHYFYDEEGNLTKKEAENGSVSQYEYDRKGNLIREKVKVSEGTYSARCYERDSYGRIIKETDGLGNDIIKEYEDKAYIHKEPTLIVDGEKQEFKYEFDEAGRTILVETAYGKAQMAYNSRNYRTYLKDGNGNITRRQYDRLGSLLYLTTPCLEGTADVWKYKYNFFDQLVEEEDPLGNRTCYERDLAGNIILEKKADRNGEETSVRRHIYDEDENRIKTIHPDGAAERFIYDAKGNLVKHIHPEYYKEEDDDGEGECYTYDAGNRLTAIYRDGCLEGNREGDHGVNHNGNYDENHSGNYDENHNGNHNGNRNGNHNGNNDVDTPWRRYIYDAAGNKVMEADAEGNETYFCYDFMGNMTEKREPVERIEGTGSDKGKEVILYQVTAWEYDLNGNRIKEKQGIEKVTGKETPSFWHTLHFTYDSLNRLTLVKDGSGAKAVYRYDCLNHKVYESFRISRDVKKAVHYCYDAGGNLIEKREELQSSYSRKPSIEIPDKAVTRYEYDKEGRCIRETSPKGYVRNRCYDLAGKLIREQEEDADNGICLVYNYKYDIAGNVVSRTQVSGCGQTVGQSQASGQNQASGTKTEDITQATIQEEERTCSYSYDSRNRLIRYRNEEGGITRIFYDRNNRITRVILPEQYKAAGEFGAGISYSYGTYGELNEIRDASGSLKEEYRYNKNGKLAVVLNGAGDIEECAYDLKGNPIQIRRGHGEEKAVQEYERDARGNITGIKDGNGNHTRFVLDGWGRISEIHTPDGGVERYGYDYAGNIISTTDANGNRILYTYNSQGNPCEITDQEGLSERFVYDEEGMPKLHIDRNRNWIHTEYILGGRLRTRLGNDAYQDKRQVERYKYNSRGELIESRGGGISYKYAYNERGLLKEKWSGNKCLLSYRYDLNGNVISIKDSAGRAAAYTYDAAGKLTDIRDTGSDRTIAVYQYDQAGRVSQVSCGNGMVTSYAYDSCGQVKNLGLKTASGGTLLDYSYRYDGNGNMLSREGKPGSRRYRYDSMNRIVGASYEGREEVRYVYDLCGNRIEKTEGTEVTSYTCNNKNQLVSMQRNEEVLRFIYDNQGNLLSQESSQGIRKYGYDLFGRQEEIELEDGSRQVNSFDGEGLRYQKEEITGEGFQNRAKVIRYQFDQKRKLIGTEEERGDDKDATSGRIIRGVDVVALWQDSEDTKESRLYYYGNDEQGSIKYLLDERGEIENQYRYDAFGVILKEREEVNNPIKYTGQEYDKLSEQYYLRARFYNPVTGRFLQEDRYRGDGLNLYAYCRNNPVVYCDTSGYSSDLSSQYQKKSDGNESVEGTGNGISNGMKVTSNEALDLADDFLGSGYKDLGNGRYMSADGTKVVRMGDSDILGKHGGGPHMNFETLAPNPAKPGKMMVIENIHIYISD